MLLQSDAAPDLARWVDAFWLLEGEVGAHRVLPDGCIDFLVDLESGYGSVAGPMTTAEVVDLPAGARIFGVRFRPGAAALLLDTPADALADQHVPLGDVVPSHVATLAERIAEAAGQQARCAEVAALLRGPGRRQRAFDARVHRATALIDRSRGAASIRSVAEDCGVSDRQLERLFHERIGIGPKLYGRIARMARAVALAESHVEPQAALAARAGYADESHMLREFRALAGLTPHALRAERHVGFVQAGLALPP